MGGKRTGVLGGEDIMHGEYSIECKSVSRFVARKWMEQAVRNNKRGKVPIVIVHEKNKNSSSDLVILRVSDWLGGADETEARDAV